MAGLGWIFKVYTRDGECRMVVPLEWNEDRPQGLKPEFVAWLDAEAEALAYLQAKTMSFPASLEAGTRQKQILTG
jgi:hypothetical protein